jgi:DNA-binding IclR family transcriptional regulator
LTSIFIVFYHSSMQNDCSAKQNRTRSGLNSGLDVLEYLATVRKPLTLTEIAANVGMSKSSIHQILATLQQRAFVRRLADQRYCIGIKAWEIGCVADSTGLARTTGPHVAQLVRELSDGVSVGVLDGAEMVCIQLVESPRAVRVHSHVGDRTPAHSVSAGLAMLAALDDEAVRRVLPSKLKIFTEATPKTAEAVISELQRVRARGYAFCRGAWRAEVGGVSVPIVGPDNHAVAALCVAVPAFRTSRDWVSRVVPALKKTAADIERDLGRADVPAVADAGE